MPLFEVELEDGSLYEIESDSEPTRDQVQSALSSNYRSTSQPSPREGMASTIPAKSREQAVMEETFASLSPGERILSDIGRFARSSIENTGTSLKGIGRILGTAPFVPNRESRISRLESELSDPTLPKWLQQAMQGEIQKQRGFAEEDRAMARDILESQPLFKAGTSIQKSAEKQFPRIQPESVSRPLGFAAEAVGGTVPFVVVGLATGGTGAILTAGGAEFEDAYQREIDRQKEKGEEADPEQAFAKASGYATAASAIESGLGVGRILRGVRKYFSPDAARRLGSEIAGSGIGPAIGRFITNRAKDAGAGFTEEALQRLIQDLIVDGEPDLAAIVQEGLAGMIGESSIGGAFEASASTAQTIQNRIERQHAQAPADQPQTTQPIQFLPEGESALQGAPLQPEVSDAVQQQSQTIPGNVLQPQVTQEGQGQVPATEGRPEAAETQVTPESLGFREATRRDKVLHPDSTHVLEEGGGEVDISIPEEGPINIDLINAGERGKGTGTKLIKKVTDLADSIGKEVFLVSTARGNVSQERLNRFYEKNGFVATDRTDNEGHPEYRYDPRSEIDVPESIKDEAQTIDREIASREPAERDQGTKTREAFENPKPVRLEDLTESTSERIPIEGEQVSRTRAAWNAIANEIKQSPQNIVGILNRWATALRNAETFTIPETTDPNSITQDVIVRMNMPQALREALQAVAFHGETLGLNQNIRRLAWRLANPSLETAGAIAPEQVLGLTFNPPAAGTSGLEKGQAPPGQTFRGPVQERDRTKPSRAKFMNFDAITQTEKGRKDYADRMVSLSRENFNSAYNELRNNDDPSYRAVATAAVLTDILDRFSKANVADKFIMEGQIDILESDMEGMMAGQFLQSFNQVNRIMAPFSGYLTHTKQARKRLRDSLLNAISVDQDITTEEATEQANQLVDSAEKQNQAEKTAVSILDRLATSQSDVLKWSRKKTSDVREAMRQFMNGDITADSFEARLDGLGVTPATSSSLRNSAEREASIRQLHAAVRDINGQRSKIARELGANEETANKLLALAQKANSAKGQRARNKVLKEMTDVLHREVAEGKIDMHDLLRDIWYATVLARGGTLVNIVAGGWANGFVVSTSAAIDTMARTRNPLMAFRVMGQFLGGIQDGAKVGWNIVKTGDVTLLPDYERRAQALLSGKGRRDALEDLWNRKGWAAVPGSLAFTRRMIIAADYMFSMPTRDSQLLYSALTREDQQSLDAIMRKFDKVATKQAEQQARDELGPDANSVDIMIRRKEILEEGVSTIIEEMADLQGRRVAANADPQGVYGALYRAISYFPFFARAPLGLGFIRATLNLMSFASDFTPIVGLASYGRSKLGNIPENSMWSFANKLKLDIPIEQQRMILVMQGMSLILTSALAALFLDDDDEEDRFGMEISGSWMGLSNDQKRALYTAKEKPLSIRFGKNGPWISFKQIPFAVPLAIIGNARDGQRFRSEEWDAQTTAQKISNAWLSGLIYMKDLSTISNFTRMFGMGAGQESVENMGQFFKRMAAESVGSFVSGFIPSVIKEVDQFMDPKLYRAGKDNSFEYWMRNIPFARRTIGAGPDLNVFGEETKLTRPPFRTWLGSGSDDPKYQVLGRFASMGIFPPVPGRTATIDGVDGERRQMNEKEFYQYQKLWADQFKDYVETNLPQMRIADKENAQWYYDDFRDSMSANKTLGRLIRNSVLPTE